MDGYSAKFLVRFSFPVCHILNIFLELTSKIHSRFQTSLCIKCVKSHFVISNLFIFLVTTLALFFRPMLKVLKQIYRYIHTLLNVIMIIMMMVLMVITIIVILCNVYKIYIAKLSIKYISCALQPSKKKGEYKR